ncbi:MAG TPA: serine hydrolase [Candidatus Acidoferrales bacterium]|nr:serine hydrolase [Candidatus Acidoferrales bacterium]
MTLHRAAKPCALIVTCVLATFMLSAAALPAPQQTTPYFPARLDWQHKKPEETGMDPARLDEAVKFAIASENPATKNMMLYNATTFGAREPFDTPIGRVKDRGPANGLIIHHGYIVAEWGDPTRVDMTFSVTKTFLTTVVGLAWQRGLIRDLNDFARDYMPPDVDLFDAPHNQKIKWDDLLRQTSDWQGTLWGKPDWADRPEGEKPADWPNRKLWDPGAHYKYNDVRVNVLALAALNVWRRPLQDVLREEIMEPIGASSTWRWYGYDNSWVEIDGQKMQSVTGGGHWGGGMFINAYDMARFGFLFLHDGKWNGRTLVSDKWIQMARTPGPANKDYGFANWFLNTDRKPWPNAPATAVCFLGNGSNVIYVDQQNDIVAVVRWISSGTALNDFLGKMLSSLSSTSK